MIIPIGHDQSGPRRIPWITFLLMLACAGTFLWTRDEALRSQAEFRERYLDAVRYAVRHPRLHRPPCLERLIPW